MNNEAKNVLGLDSEGLTPYSRAYKKAIEKEPVPMQEQEAYAKLFTLVTAMTFMGGGSGRYSGTAALNSMASAMEGYKKGRKDVFEQELKNYDKYMKSTIENNKRLSDLLTKKLEAMKDGDQIKTMQIDAELKALTSNQGALAGIEKMQAEQIVKTRDKIDELNREYIKDERARQERILQRQMTLSGYYKDVQGQLRGLVSNYKMPVEDASKLGPKEISSVASDLESAVVTQDLANDIKKHPYAAGIVGSFINKMDKYVPSRYANEDSAVGIQILKGAADGLSDPSLTEDQMSEARKIAKKAVDVINARAMAATGSGRVLVSELNMQKGVIGLEGLSAKSAVDIYQDLARRDVDKIKKYGVSQNYVDSFKSSLSSSPATKSRQESVVVGDKTYTRPANFTDQQWADYKRAVGAEK